MRRYGVPLLVAGLLIWLFYPAVLFHWKAAHDPYLLGPDVQQYVPVFDEHDSGVSVTGRYIKDYYAKKLMLPGYKWLYEFAGAHWDTHSMARQLPYVLYLLTIALLVAIAWRTGGAWPATSTLVLMLSTGFIFQFGYAGGTSRMFAYTFLALALWTLRANRPVVLALITVLASLFYPLVAAICGISLALWLMLLPKDARGVVAAWRVPKKLFTLAVTAMLTLAVVLPSLLPDEYGRRVVAEDIAAYPEVGSTGRYRFPGDALPYPWFQLHEVAGYFMRSLLGNGKSPIPVLNIREHRPAGLVALFLVSLGALYIIVRGFGVLIRQQPGSVRLLLPFAAAILLYVMAHILAPYLYIPGRYLVYTLPLAAVFLFPLGLYGLSVVRKRPHAHAIIWGPVLVIFLLWGGRGDAYTAWTVVIPPAQRSFYEEIAKLPADILIAGWPQSRNEWDINLDNIAFLSRRSVLLTRKTHQTLHLHFVQKMRRRMDAVMAAYFATDVSPVLRLHEEYGVTHLLVDISHFADNPPVYFAPWDMRIASARAKAGDQAFLAHPAAYADAVVIRRGSIMLLDLAKLDRNSNER